MKGESEDISLKAQRDFSVSHSWIQTENKQSDDCWVKGKIQNLVVFMWGVNKLKKQKYILNIYLGGWAMVKVQNIKEEEKILCGKFL